MNEGGIITTSGQEMELITEKFYTNPFRFTIPVLDPEIPPGERPPRILPLKVRVAIENMKAGTAPKTDNITADFFRGGGHKLHVILAKHDISSEEKNPRPVEDITHRSPAQKK